MLFQCILHFLAIVIPIILLGHLLLDVNTFQPAAALLREKWETGYKNDFILCLPQVLLCFLWNKD